MSETYKLGTTILTQGEGELDLLTRRIETLTQGLQGADGTGRRTGEVTNLGSSVGISRVRTNAEYAAAVTELAIKRHTEESGLKLEP